MASLFKNYKWRVVFGIISVLFVIVFIVNIVTYTITRRVIERQLQLSTQSVAVAVSLMIANDLDSYRDFLRTRDVNSDYYRKMQADFAKIKSENHIRFLYTTNRTGETNTEFILDAEPIGSENYSAPGDIEEENTVTLQAFNTKQPAALPPTRSPFGILLGGCAPILDERGEVAGVVGVDIDNSTVFSALKNLFIILIAVCLFLLILIGFLLSKTSHLFLEPMLKDKLTGAYNKRYSDTLIQNCVDSALKLHNDLSVMMLDLDHFKNVNDTYGHNFGDIVLSKAAAVIQDCLRRDDILVRYGGEEFLVLLFDLDCNIAMMVAERIRQSMESYEIYNEKENINIKITISIGVTSLRHRKITGLDLINKADQALYKAKETRNAAILFD